jgi:hypothetical protein
MQFKCCNHCLGTCCWVSQIKNLLECNEVDVVGGIDGARNAVNLTNRFQLEVNLQDMCLNLRTVIADLQIRIISTYLMGQLIVKLPQP